MAVVGAAIVVGCGSLAGAASHARVSHPDISVFWVDSTSGPVVQGIQNGNGIGVEGVVGATAGAIGMAGFANNAATQNIGLEGVVRGPNSVGLLGQALLASGLPSIGLEGTSNNGVGVEGQSLLAAGVGVLAKDLSNTKVAQMGVGGGPAVLGTSGFTSFTQPGLQGETSDATATDLTGGAAFGFNAFTGAGPKAYYGALGYGSHNGLFGLTTNTGASLGAAAVYGQDQFNGSSGVVDLNAGVQGVSEHGLALLSEGGPIGTVPTSGFLGSWTFGSYSVANSTGATSGSVGADVEVQDNKAWGLSVFSTAAGNGEVDIMPGGGLSAGPLIRATGGSGSMLLDQAGNMTISGHMTTAGGILIVGHGASGARWGTYSNRSTMPTIEDNGQARLVGGQAYVRIDSVLSDTIDHKTAYLVSITPEGDSRGLYVAQKTPTGFLVRENQGGHSTLTFDYRIIAKPVDSDGARLAAMPAPRREMAPQLVGRSLVRRLTQMQARDLFYGAGSRARASDVARLRNASAARNSMLNRLPRADASGVVHLGNTQVQKP